MKKNGLVRKILFGALLFFLASTIPAYAKEGFYLGLEIPFNKIGGDFDDKKAPVVKGGSGLGFIAGYGITPAFSLELDLAGSGHKSAGADISFGEFSLNGKYAFNIEEHVQPFLFAGIGSFTLGDDSLTYGGSGYNLGLGIDYYSSPQLSWGAALIGKIITYDKVVKGSKPASVTGNLNGETSSLRFDVSYHF
jgi:hypothetical protein